MKVVTTLHPPSAVLSSVRCNLSSKSAHGHLVISKPNRVEVFSLEPEGFKLECGIDIWGRVMCVRAVRAETRGFHNVLVLTDHPDPRLILLKFDDSQETAKLTDIWSESLLDRNGRPAEYLTDIIVHPAGKAVVVSCYAGKLKVLTFKGGKVDKNFDAILPELNLMALSFVYSEPNEHTHTLALIYLDYRQKMRLLARELDVDAYDLSVEVSPTIPHVILPGNQFPITEMPPKLVAVPPFPLSHSPVDVDEDDPGSSLCRGGVIVLGGRKIHFYELSDKRKEKQRAKKRKNSTSEDVYSAEQRDSVKEAKKVKPRATVKWPWSEVTVCCPADGDMRRFFMGDIYGRLSLLTLSDTPELILIPLGETSAATTISYLSSQVLYLGSLSGDSQLLRIHPSPQSNITSDTLPISETISTISPSALSAPRDESPEEDYDMRDVMDTREAKGGKVVKTKGSYIEVLTRFKNIAPIIDAVLADPDESGQPQIVTCSGGNNTGSINIVRTGADFQELAVLNEIPNVINIWPIRPRFEDSDDCYVLATTLHESYLFRIDGRDSITRIDPTETGLDLSQRTLALANIPRRVGATGSITYQDSSMLLQITPSGLILLEHDYMLDAFSKAGNGWYLQQQDNPVWRSKEIVAASINTSQFAVALSGGTVLLFHLGQDNQISLQKSKELLGKEIASICCTPFDPSKSFALYVAVSFWESNTIALLDIKKDLAVKTESAPLPALPRSILLHNFGSGNNKKELDYQPHAVAGLTDGTVACVAVRNDELKDHKLFALGTAPVSLSLWEVEGKRAVFATGSRSAVFQWVNQRLRQSHVMLKNITVGSTLNSVGFPACQIVATPSSLIIGQTRGIDKMQIRSISLGYESPRRIAYHSRLNMFGVSLAKCAPSRIGEAEIQESIFKTFDGITMSSLSEFSVDADEDITAVHALTHQDATGTFVIGTVKNQIGEYEPSSGRLILFDHGADGVIKKVAEIDTKGCVYAIASVGAYIAIAVNTSVALYTAEQHAGTISLRKVTEWNHNYIVTSLVAKGNKLFSGDAISSVSILEVNQGSLRSVARDYGPVWPVSIEATREGGVIVGNNDGNLLTFSLPEARDNKLERTGNYYLGETVNRFIAGSLSSQTSTDGQQPLFETEHIFFAPSGRIGLVHHVDSDEVSLHLTAIQRNMASLITGPGQTKHTQWRSPANFRGRSDMEDAATGFLDGDFLEEFLTRTDQERILEGRIAAERVPLSVDQVEGVLEKLQSLH